MILKLRKKNTTEGQSYTELHEELSVSMLLCISVLIFCHILNFILVLVAIFIKLCPIAIKEASSITFSLSTHNSGGCFFFTINTVPLQHEHDDRVGFVCYPHIYYHRF